MWPLVGPLPGLVITSKEQFPLGPRDNATSRRERAWALEPEGPSFKPTIYLCVTFDLLLTVSELHEIGIVKIIKQTNICKVPSTQWVLCL